MGRIMTKFEKYTLGSACCMLEEYEGTGCESGCPYSVSNMETATCKAELENDEDSLKHIISSLEAFIEEADGSGS